MRKFQYYTYDSYIRKTKDMIKYFDKPLEEVYYNSVIRFVYEVTWDNFYLD